MHCHILPGVDDGAQNLEESLEMAEAAMAIGITSIVCTPHVRDPYFDGESYERALRGFEELKAELGGLSLRLGWEVNHRKLMELGNDWIDRLAFAPVEPTRYNAAEVAKPREFLLELSTHASEASFADYERTVYEIMSRGYDVIIAHPERYEALRRKSDPILPLVRMGARLQASADFMDGGRLGTSRKPAKRMIEEGLYSYVASDAHCVADYEALERAWRSYPEAFRCA